MLLKKLNLDKKYDYLVVGAGLYGSIFAYEANKRGKKILVIDKKNHIGGNCYTSFQEGIHVHKYGAHIFHTSNKEVYEYMNNFAEFNHFINSPIANYKGELYNLPFNMNTFYQLWGVKTPKEAQEKINSQQENIIEPNNLEEQAIKMVGKDIYEKLIKDYTRKQWGRPCNELPASIIKRLPVRFTFNNNYFNDTHQGIPIGGYTQIFEKMLNGIDVKLGIDYLDYKDELSNLAEKIIYTGPIDAYFDYQFGPLAYRSVEFKEEIYPISNFQGNAVVNYTDLETPYTRVIEHKHFDYVESQTTIISKEFSSEWNINKEPYYPVNDDTNNELYLKYLELSKAEKNVHFGGRLAEYKYFDMHIIIEKALSYFKKEINDL